MSIGKEHPLAGELVEMGRFNDGIAVDARVGKTPVIGNDEEDVRSGVGGWDGEFQGEVAKKETESQQGKE
ncbi:hypothetical protein GCM10027423_57370 [Spirosoma arcticum]